MKPILKLIEVNQPLMANSLWYYKRDKDKQLVNGASREILEEYYYSRHKDDYVVVNPYGIFGKPTHGDTYIDTLQNTVHLMGKHKLYTAPQLVKVAIHPEEFNYQDIIDLKLKDGDELPVRIGHSRDTNYAVEDPHAPRIPFIVYDTFGKVILHKTLIDVQRVGRIPRIGNIGHTMITFPVGLGKAEHSPYYVEGEVVDMIEKYLLHVHPGIYQYTKRSDIKRWFDLNKKR